MSDPVTQAVFLGSMSRQNPRQFVVKRRYSISLTFVLFDRQLPRALLKTTDIGGN
jgi:hypothetical protein